MKMSDESKVCVTGGSGYIGSWLIKKLLAKGYTVHATLRDLKNESKVRLLKSLPHAEGKLVLFEADIYDPTQFDPAIQGCEFVFHVATPLTHEPGSSQQYKDTTEAAVAGAKSIAMSCVRSGTVKRLIYTASVVSASPLKEDGSGFKDVMDETCWTPLNDSFECVYLDDPLYKDYTYSKTLSEKYLLSYANDENCGGGLEVVTLPCGLVGGDTLLSSIKVVCIAQIIQNERAYKSLKFLEGLLGKIPLVHIDDVCEAHIFCMESTFISGRFLCASSYISLQEMANHYALHHPEFTVKQDCLQFSSELHFKHEDGLKKDIKWTSTKLCDRGFVYKYDAKMILDDCIKCARRMGEL